MAHIIGNFFICIGAQKAGTRWLHENLMSHPDVWVPYVKELHYFDGVHIPSHHGYLQKLICNAKRRADSGALMSDAERRWHAIYGSPTPLGDAWYASLFAEASTIHAFGEITPEYSMLPDEGFAHIAKLAPQARIIFIMRDPVERVWSQIRFRAQNSGDKTLLLPSKAIRFVDTFPAEARTMYDRTMERIERYFPQGQILYLFYEDIPDGGLDVLRRVSDFLGVTFDPAYYPKARERLNVSPIADMPPEVRNHLQAKYAYLSDVIEAKLGRVPTKWRSHFGLG